VPHADPEARRASSKAYYQRNRERRRVQAKAAYQKNKARLRELNRAWRQRNPERTRQLNREWDRRNAERRRRRARERYQSMTPERAAALRESWKRYRERNREKIRSRNKARIATDPGYKFAQLLRSRVGKALKEQHAAKAFKTIDLVGCSMHDLLAHFERHFQPGMSWQNYGRHGWHVDHIVPCAAFDLSRPDQQKICFHYTNLRPAWESDNVRRQSRIEGELPLLYLNRKTGTR